MLLPGSVNHLFQSNGVAAEAMIHAGLSLCVFEPLESRRHQHALGNLAISSLHVAHAWRFAAQWDAQHLRISETSGL